MEDWKFNNPENDEYFELNYCNEICLNDFNNLELNSKEELCLNNCYNKIFESRYFLNKKIQKIVIKMIKNKINK